MFITVIQLSMGRCSGTGFIRFLNHLQFGRKEKPHLKPTLFAGPAANDWRAADLAVESTR